jgi:hypothetical protein
MSDETHLVKGLLPDIDFTINIGANIGRYNSISLHTKMPVIAFELNIQHLLNSISSNKLQANTEIFPIALSNYPGILDIYGGGSDASLIQCWAGTADNFSCLIPSSTLDLVLGNLFVVEQLLIIVEIEGALKRMLVPAIKLFDMNPRPLWLVEINVAVHQPKGITMNPFLLETF